MMVQCENHPSIKIVDELDRLIDGVDDIVWEFVVGD